MAYAVVAIHGISVSRRPGWARPWFESVKAALDEQLIESVHEFTWEPPDELNGRRTAVADALADVWALADPSVGDSLGVLFSTASRQGRLPLLVLAHSWGSVLAYQTLLHWRSLTDVFLLTFGSPLVYAERGPLATLTPTLTRPRRVMGWANVWGVFDYVSRPPFRTGYISVADRNYMAFVLHDSTAYVSSSGFKRAVRWLDARHQTLALLSG